MSELITEQLCALFDGELPPDQVELLLKRLANPLISLAAQHGPPAVLLLTRGLKVMTPRRSRARPRPAVAQQRPQRQPSRLAQPPLLAPKRLLRPT